MIAESIDLHAADVGLKDVLVVVMPDRHDRGIIECVNQVEEIPSVDFDKARASGGIQI